MSAVHTPGPWWLRYEADGLPPSYWIVEGGHGLGEAGVHIALFPRLLPEAEATQAANARLIAAAPTLLEALQSVRAAWGNIPGMRSPMGLKQQIDDAIAAATGEQA